MAAPWPLFPSGNCTQLSAELLFAMDIDEPAQQGFCSASACLPYCLVDNLQSDECFMRCSELMLAFSTHSTSYHVGGN